MATLKKELKVFECPRCSGMQKNPGTCENDECLYFQTVETAISAERYCKNFGHLFTGSGEKTQGKKEKEACGCILRQTRHWLVCKTCRKEKWGEWETHYRDECQYHHAESCLTVLHL
jgi:hypothetical protein